MHLKTAREEIDRLSYFQQLLRPSKIRAISARDAILQAKRFEALEAEFVAQNGKSYQPLRVSVLSALSLQHFVSVLRLHLFSEGFRPEFEVSEFDGISANAFDEASRILSQLADVLVVLPDTSEIRSWPPLFASKDEIEHWVEEQARPLLSVWQLATRANSACRIYQASFVEPLERQLGNLEAGYAFSRTRCIRRLNMFLQENRPAQVTLIDLEYIAALAGKTNWFDETAYFTSKQPFSLRMLPLVCSYISRLVAAGRGSVRKCLVLDLDNTVWGGVVGDDGVGGLRLSPGDPAGEAYLTFQRYLRALKERGVILAVCSKNDEAVARSPFLEHPDVILREDDFASFVANWDDKVTNIRRIAEELNIGLDSLVFFDDNPAERAIIEQYEPAVWVVNVPDDPAQFVRALNMSFAFEWPQLTEEDAGRAASFQGERARKRKLETFANYDAYLESLGMQAVIRPVRQSDLPRFHQLINKTNQFNVRTQRYSEQQLSELAERKDYVLLDVRFADQFTNYGGVANVVLRVLDDTLFVENWVMSCRTFKRGLEDATLEAIIRLCLSRGYKRVVGEYIETRKNGYVKSLFAELGFAALGDPDELPLASGGGRRFSLMVNDAVVRPHHISVAV